MYKRINRDENLNIKKKLIKIIEDKNSTKNEKRDKVKFLLFRIIDKNLRILYQQTQKNKLENNESSETDQFGGKVNKLLHVANKLPELTDYEVNNNRELCWDNNSNKDSCTINKHCHWSYEECNFSLPRELIIQFVSRVSDEFSNNDHRVLEILQEEGYYVSDVADNSKFKQRDGQKILKSNNANINKTLAEL